MTPIKFLTFKISPLKVRPPNPPTICVIIILCKLLSMNLTIALKSGCCMFLCCENRIWRLKQLSASHWENWNSGFAQNKSKICKLAQGRNWRWKNKHVSLKSLRDAFLANKYYLRHRQGAITLRWENIDKNIIIAPVFKLKLGPWEG